MVKWNADESDRIVDPKKLQELLNEIGEEAGVGGGIPKRAG